MLAVNGSLFNTDAYGTYPMGMEKIQGVWNTGRWYSGVEDFNKCMAVGLLTDGSIIFDSQENILNTYYGTDKDDELYAAITGAFGILKDGQSALNMYADYYTSGSVDNIRDRSATRTIIGVDEAGNILSWSPQTALLGSALPALCKTLGFHTAICFDGGGSVWRRISGGAYETTSRLVKNALILYRRLKTRTVTEEVFDHTEEVEVKEQREIYQTIEVPHYVDQEVTEIERVIVGYTPETQKVTYPTVEVPVTWHKNELAYIDAQGRKYYDLASGEYFLSYDDATSKFKISNNYSSKIYINTGVTSGVKTKDIIIDNVLEDRILVTADGKELQPYADLAITKEFKTSLIPEITDLYIGNGVLLNLSYISREIEYSVEKDNAELAELKAAWELAHTRYMNLFYRINNNDEITYRDTR